MPLTKKGRKILARMRRTYPTEEKAQEVFHASENAGTITGVHEGGRRRARVRVRRRPKRSRST